MRKLLILAAPLLAAALVPGTPAKADVGCQCVKFGAPSVCTATVSECNRVIGGLCMAPCTYHPPVKRHAAAKKPKMAKAHVTAAKKPKAMKKNEPAPKEKKM